MLHLLLRISILAASVGVAAPGDAQSLSPGRPAGPLVQSGERHLAQQAKQPPRTGERPTRPADDADVAGLPSPEQNLTRLQLGIGLKSTNGLGNNAAGGVDPTFEWRLRGKTSKPNDRWAFAYRLGSFSSRVSSVLGSSDFEVGDVKLRPLMVGAEYKMPRGKWRWSVGATTGWAINNVETPGEYRQEALRLGVQDLHVDVHNSFVWGPRAKGWYERDRRLSYFVEAGYIMTRPELDVRLNGVITTKRLNADSLIFKAGIVYGIF